MRRNRPAPYQTRPAAEKALAGPITPKQPTTFLATQKDQGGVALNAPLSDILKEAKCLNIITYPKERTKPLVNIDPAKWCDYHKMNGHVTDQCWTLRYNIERLIKHGHLLEFVDPVVDNGVVPVAEEDLELGDLLGNICSISDGEISSARKRYSCMVNSVHAGQHGFDHPNIIFSPTDFEGWPLTRTT